MSKGVYIKFVSRNEQICDALYHKMSFPEGFPKTPREKRLAKEIEYDPKTGSFNKEKL